MPKITYPQLRDWLGKAITIGGDIYGLAKTVMTLVSLFGNDYKGEEEQIAEHCDKIREEAITILDLLALIEEEVDRAD